MNVLRCWGEQGQVGTLEKKLCWNCRPSSGSIFIDGVHIDQLDLAELRNAIGYLPQDVQLISGTVYDDHAGDRLSGT